MFKKLTAIGLSSLLLLQCSIANAVNFQDVPSSYWAYTQITELTDEEVMNGYSDGTFKPEGKVSREEFASMLVKALNQQSYMPEKPINYKDMQKEMKSYVDVNKIDNLDLVVGYPDNTFKPVSNITKTEAMIVLANTLSGKNLTYEEAEKVLSMFMDKNSVKDWAKGTVSKAVQNNVYVKYPNASVLSPNNTATRAEIADLLYKIRKSPALLAQYRINDKVVSVSDKNQEFAAVQHLIPGKNSTSNEVEVKLLTARIEGGNVIEAAFVSDFTSKKASIDDPVKLVLKEDLYTQEGTFLIPAGTIIEGTISKYIKAKLYNRNAKVAFKFDKMILPSGTTYDIYAGVASKTGWLESGYNMNNFKRDAITAVSVVGAGAAIGALAGLTRNSGEGAVIGTYSAAGPAVIAAAVAPGYEICFKSGDKIAIKFFSGLKIDR